MYAEAIDNPFDSLDSKACLLSTSKWRITRTAELKCVFSKVTKLLMAEITERRLETPVLLQQLTGMTLSVDHRQCLSCRTEPPKIQRLE